MNRTVSTGIKGLSIAASCALGCGNAFAQVAGGAVPLPPTFSESVTSISYITGRSSTKSGSGPYEVTNGVATAGTSYTRATEGEASLTIEAGSALVQEASASVSWNFIVNGPADQIVFVGLQGRGMINIVQPEGSVNYDYASATVSGNAFGNLIVQQSFKGIQNYGISIGNYLKTDTVYTISETLSAFSYPFGGGTTDLIQDSIDPALYLWDNSGTYSIALSPAAPEPATWAMMLAGFGLAGFGLRHSRKQAVRGHHRQAAHL
jgi:hypothetical protein